VNISIENGTCNGPEISGKQNGIFAKELNIPQNYKRLKQFICILIFLNKI